MKNKKIPALIFIIIILLSTGCQTGKKIEVYNMNEYSSLEFDENGKMIVREGLMGLSVYGKGGEIIFQNICVNSDYKENISVADLSKDICRELTVPIVFSGMGDMAYVKGINGLFEFDCGTESGWLYSVNGEYQGVGCGTYILENGDYVEWHYTLDLGKDLGAFELDE